MGMPFRLQHWLSSYYRSFKNTQHHAFCQDCPRLVHVGHVGRVHFYHHRNWTWPCSSLWSEACSLQGLCHWGSFIQIHIQIFWKEKILWKKLHEETQIWPLSRRQ